MFFTYSGPKMGRFSLMFSSKYPAYAMNFGSETIFRRLGFIQ